MNIRLTSILLLLTLPFFGWQCKGGKNIFSNFNLLPVEQDIQLGQEVQKEIASKPGEYPLLPEKGNEQVYQYIRGITNKILNTGKLTYRNEFPWEVKIIHDDKTLNAFCAPGGYIYVYTGLIKFLDSEDQFAGVLGHEIAHADLRHSTRQITKAMGLSIVAEILIGQQPDQLKQLAVGLIGLSFSREHETEADMASVDYLCGTEYNAAGAAGFFRKMEGQPSPPVFLSTHPSPKNRVKKIDEEKIKLTCAGGQTYNAKYVQMKNLLPK
ncbi:MAG: M48 family metalloprotease [Saprospiraceae bacterium]|nr:M48 family metalloprotease [Saprospiraceae bacterium]